VTEAYDRYFPFDRPYPDQQAAMAAIGAALSAGTDVLMEGATGTGKTLAALAPALAVAADTGRTVIICTNVHQQMRQFISDARAICQREPLRAVVFQGKRSMCHIDVGYRECQALRDRTRELVEVETEQAELRAEADRLLAAMQAGDADAAAGRAAVMGALAELEETQATLAGGNTCAHYAANLREETDGFLRWLYDDVRTPEEIYAQAEQAGWCGYELLKEGMERPDLVVCNYQHLLDPQIRRQLFRWIDRTPEEVMLVFDEAHNVEAAARDHASQTLTIRTIDRAIAECADLEDARAAAVTQLLEELRRQITAQIDAQVDATERSVLDERWMDVPLPGRSDDPILEALRAADAVPAVAATTELALQLGGRLDAAYERAYQRGDSSTRRTSPTLTVAGFLDQQLAAEADPYRLPVGGIRHDESADAATHRLELFTTIPASVTRPLFAEVAATVLMSATMRPFDVTAEVLGMPEATQLSYPMRFDPDRRRTLTVGTPALFQAERRNPETQAAITGVLADAIGFTPGRSLLFFPSYAEAERYAGRLRARLDRPVLVDAAGVQTQPLRETFLETADAVLCTSLWGTLTEGVSFDDDAARAVAVVGVPYPHLSERRRLVQAAYDAAVSHDPDAGWRYAVEIPTVRRIRQALGRIIRGPDDYGVRLLLDERYTRAGMTMGQYAVRGSFPQHERAEMIDVDPAKVRYAVRTFFTECDAYPDGPPPIEG
jgi:DNA excision repair protein ERCC-2